MYWIFRFLSVLYFSYNRSIVRILSVADPPKSLRSSFWRSRRDANNAKWPNLFTIVQKWWKLLLSSLIWKKICKSLDKIRKSYWATITSMACVGSLKLWVQMTSKSSNLNEKIKYFAVKLPKFHGYTLGDCRVHIFWEGHKILRDLPLTFDYRTYS